jgi:hypothetical protein
MPGALLDIDSANVSTFRFQRIIMKACTVLAVPRGIRESVIRETFSLLSEPLKALLPKPLKAWPPGFAHG